MSNLLKMAKVQSIRSLHAQGWPARRIARELGVDRETVRKYVLQPSCEPKPANLPTGSADSKPANLPTLPALASKPAGNLPTGSSRPHGPPSQAEPYREAILVGVAAGLSATRIHQDLTGDGATVGYDSVRRFIRRLGRTRDLAVPADGMRCRRRSASRLRHRCADRRPRRQASQDARLSDRA